ncbi:MAG: GumC family protein [Gammaproteobacteria bacterium]
MSQNDIKELSDYLAILRRRKWQLVLPVAIIFALCSAIAFLLPAQYQSKATILIEQQEIPADLIRSTITSYADQRIQTISQRVMTSKNLNAIIDKFDLYADERRTRSMDVVFEKMRDDIAIDLVNADVVDPRSGRPSQATIAFTLTFNSEFPRIAQQVANELASLYLNENIKSRTQAAIETSIFMEDESGKLREKLRKLEVKLASFKEKNIGRLPELMQLNIQLMDRTEQQLLETKQQIRALNERKVYLESELDQLAPNAIIYSSTGERILGPEDRLKALESEYIGMAATYSPEHPSLAKARREIEALRAAVGGEVDTSELALKIKGMKADIAAMVKRYSADHPDVIRKKKALNAIETELAERIANGVQNPAETSKPDNPAYIKLQALLESATSDLESLKITEHEQIEKLAELEKRLTMTPQIEKEYLELKREHENTNAKYNEIKAKQLEANLAESLEREQKGERFSLIEPPMLPSEPSKPNRLAILFLGFILSLGGGVGTTAVAENLDKSIRGSKSLTGVANIPPIAILPYVESEEEIKKRSSRTHFIIIGAIIGLIIAVALFHFFVKPLDVTWFMLQRRFGLI